MYNIIKCMILKGMEQGTGKSKFTVVKIRNIKCMILRGVEQGTENSKLTAVKI